jgi:hypothetical protein
VARRRRSASAGSRPPPSGAATRASTPRATSGPTATSCSAAPPAS